MRLAAVALGGLLTVTSLATLSCKKKEAAGSAPAPSAAAVPPDMALNPFGDTDGAADDMLGALGEGAQPPPPKLSLTNAGGEPKAPLVYDFPLHKPKTVVVTLRTQVKQQAEGMAQPMEGGGPPVRMTLTVDPTEKLPTGATKFAAKVQKAELVAPPGQALPKEMAGQFELMSKALSQVSAEFAVSKQGTVSDFAVKADPLSQQVAGDLLPLLQESSELLFITTPEEPVGPGAQWQVLTQGPAGMGGGNMTATFTLKDRNPQGATIGIETKRVAPPQVVRDPRAPQGTTMEMAGKGAYTVNVRFASVGAKSTGESETTITTKDPSTQPPRTQVATVKATQTVESK